MSRLLHDLEADTKLALLLVPVGAQEFEAAYLRRGPHVLADAGADVIVADAHQADGLGGIGRQAVGIDALGQVVAIGKLIADGHVESDEAVHLRLDLLLLLARGLVVELVGDLALLALHVGVVASLRAKEADHQLVEQVLGGMSRRKLLLVVLVEYRFLLHHHFCYFIIGMILVVAD